MEWYLLGPGTVGRDRGLIKGGDGWRCDGPNQRMGASTAPWTDKGYYRRQSNATENNTKGVEKEHIGFVTSPHNTKTMRRCLAQTGLVGLLKLSRLRLLLIRIRFSPQETLRFSDKGCAGLGCHSKPSSEM